MSTNVSTSYQDIWLFSKNLVHNTEAMKYALLDHLPSFVGDPLDGRLKQLVLGIQSVRSDWDIEPMKGLPSCDSPWLGHAAFVHAMVMYFKPRVIVDLGVHLGCSTFAMGLALKKLGRGMIYAIDTWDGDEHIGHYGENVYSAFMNQVDRLDLRAYVNPLRMRFNEAVAGIKDQVDLLHVDGFHTYSAAREDFGLFRRQLTPGALVLFHDVYNWGFPSLRLYWHLMSLRYRSYRVKHSSGLGIVLNRGGDKTLGLGKGTSLINQYRQIRSRIKVADGCNVGT
jgi:Methyltransferase domain